MFWPGGCGTHKGAMHRLTELVGYVELQSSNMTGCLSVCTHFHFLILVWSEPYSVQLPQGGTGGQSTVYRVLVPRGANTSRLPYICGWLPEIRRHYGLADVGPWLDGTVTVLWVHTGKWPLLRGVKVAFLKEGQQ